MIPINDDNSMLNDTVKENNAKDTMQIRQIHLFLVRLPLYDFDIGCGFIHMHQMVAAIQDLQF